MPVGKVEKYIHCCVDSILGQTYADFELILVDDGSPDNCGAICYEFAAKDSRVVVIHQENGGLSAARNAGIDWAFANSDSQWLTFIDSHDALVEQIEFFRSTEFYRVERTKICELMLKLQDKFDWFEKKPGVNDEFLRLIKRMRRRVILRYLLQLKSSDNLDGWTLTWVFPRTMWIYWRVRAVLRKLRIIK